MRVFPNDPVAQPQEQEVLLVPPAQVRHGLVPERSVQVPRVGVGVDVVDLVGGDVVEVAPPFDPSGNTALVGATMMFEILCVVAEARAARS